MRYRLGFIFLPFILFAATVSAQTSAALNHYSDSLYQAAEKLQDSDEKIHALFDLSFFWSDYDTTRAFTYIAEAEKIAGRKMSTDYYSGLRAFYSASIRFDGDPAAAKKDYLLAEDLLTKVNDPRAKRYRVRLWGSYGALLQREGKAHEYVEVLLEKAIPLAKEINDATLLGNNLQNVAMTLMNMRQYDKARTYYTQALSILQGRQGAEEQLLTLYVNAARNSLFRKDLAAAREFLNQAASAIQLLPFSTYVPTYYAVEGSYWHQKGDWKRSLTQLDTALAKAKALSSEDIIVGILYDKVDVLKTAGRHEDAQQTLLQVLPYVEKKPLLRNKQLIYYDIAHLHTLLGNYKEAAGWYEKYKLVTDRVLAHAGEARLLELEKKYQTAEKEKELLQAKATNQEQQQALDRTRNWLLLSGLVCLLLLTLSMLWYHAIRTRKRFAVQQERLHSEELKTLQQRAKINVFNAMVQGQEKERSRIARDLHDGLGGMLASVKLKLSAVANNEKQTKQVEGSPMELYNIIQQLDQSVTELRRVARNMMPESLLYMGLEAALRDLCRAMSQAQLPVSFEASGLRKDYDQSFLIAVYRIAQELLTNAVKHSQASQIWLQCNESDGHFYLSVEDNGTGFDYQAALQQPNGIGLANIKNRVALLNGQLDVDAVPGKGTSFHIDLNLNG